MHTARSCARLAVALLALLALPLRAAPAQRDTSYETVLLQLRIKHGPPDTLTVGLARDSVVFLPFAFVLETAELAPATIVPGLRIDGRAPDGVTYEIDVARRVARRGITIRPLQPGDLMWRGDTAYVATPMIGWLLDVAVVIDWPELVVSATNADALPVVRRLARERLRDALLAAAPESAAVLSLPASRRVLGGAVLDWSVTSSTNDPFGTSGWQLGLGTDVLGGSLTAEHSAQTNPFGTVAETHATLQYAWPERTVVRQLALGDITTGGPRARYARGVIVTNAPFLRPSAFAMEEVRGAYAPGWTVELYRGEDLIGFADAGPRGEIRLPVPVTYGPNPLDLVAYGPHGERDSRPITFEVPFERLPSGRFEYALSGGSCLETYCARVLSADTRYGVTGRLTAQAGMEYFWRDTLPDAAHPYLAGYAAITRALSVSAEGVLHGSLTGQASYDPGPDLHLSVVHARFDSSDTAPIIGSLTNRQRTTAVAFWRPRALGLGALFIQATGTRTATTTTWHDAFRLAVTGYVAGYRAVVGISQQRDGGDTVTTSQTTADAGIDGTLPGPSAIAGTFVRVQGTWVSGTGPTQVSVGAARQLIGPVRLDVTTRWVRGQNGFAVDLVLQTALPGLRAVSRNTVTADSAGLSVLGAQLFEGSVLWNRHTGGFTPSNGRALGRSGIVGEVFLDENGNGRRDDGEPALPGVVLRMGSRSAVTDATGRVEVWDLVPFEVTTIEVDTLALPDPLWVPATGLIAVRPAPNGFQFVAIPIVPGGDVSGQVVFDSGARAANGVRVNLVNLGSGETWSATTFSDGTFLRLGLKPGDYEAKVAVDALARLNATATVGRFTIQPRDGRGSATGVLLRLTPRAR